MNRERIVTDMTTAIVMTDSRVTAGDAEDMAWSLLDIALPRIGSAGELDTLDPDTWLASSHVHWTKAVKPAAGWSGYDFEVFGPLTIVWRCAP